MRSVRSREIIKNSLFGAIVTNTIGSCAPAVAMLAPKSRTWDFNSLKWNTIMKTSRGLNKVIGLALCAGILSSCAAGVSNIQDNEAPVRLSHLSAGPPDYAGGIGARMSFSNVGDKAIKYLRFTAAPYNRVGDLQKSDIGGHSEYVLEVQGPLEPGQSRGSEFFGYVRWERLWYNRSIVCLELVRMELIFMDDTTRTFGKPVIDRMMNRGVRNYCRG